MSTLGRIGTLLRTVRPLRPAQVVAQLRHALAPGHRIVRLDEAPALAVDAVPVPFLAPAGHARLREDGGAARIELLNRALPFEGAPDWDFAGEGPLFSYQLHQHDWLRDPAASPSQRASLLLDWVERHREGIGWDPHPISHRVLSWGKLLLTPRALALDDASDRALRRSLGSQVETLSRNLELRLQANHLFTNLLATVFGGLLFDGRRADRWLRCVDALRAELRDQVLPDGAHEERSPMYHALLLEQVLDALNLARASRRAPKELVDELRDTASRMCGALELFTHPDGEIALFGDSALGIAACPADLFDYASALGVPVQLPEQRGRLPYAGFVRLADERFCLIASVAGPSPEHQPGHAHADALAFELSVDGERVVTDTGVFEYMAGPARDTARATRSHSTLEIDGHDQAELWAPHRVGGRPEVAVVEATPGVSCEAFCAGWATPGVVHRRSFELADGVLSLRDRVEGSPRRVRLTLPFAPQLEPRLGEDRRSVRVPLRGGARLEIELPAAGKVAWRLEPCDYFPEFGLRQERLRLVGESDAFDDGSWRFRLTR